MIASYNNTGTEWQFFDDSLVLIEVYVLVDTSLTVSVDATSNQSRSVSSINGLLSAGVIFNDGNKKTLVTNREIVSMGLQNDYTLIAQFDFDKANAIDGIGGGGGGDVISDYYSDINSLTYYYYGYNRNGSWEFLRTLKSNINVEEKATIDLNPTVLNLTQAITQRVALIYS